MNKITTEWGSTIVIKRCRGDIGPGIREDKRQLEMWQIAMKKTLRKREVTTTPTTEAK
jgi:hypothetical protein